eukprot:15366746-Ditylum_brightwellii.AAC.3
MGCKKYITKGSDQGTKDVWKPANGTDNQKYQMLLGMLNWIVILGRLDIAYAVSSIACFTTYPRKGHNTRLLYTFGYLKKKSNRRIRIDHRDPAVAKNGAEGQLEVDLLAKMREHYPKAEESNDDQLLKSFFDELEITSYVDSDHAHNKLTRRSITGLIIFVGCTSVLYQPKRQGTVETSTHGAEFIVMKTAVEEGMTVRYMLQSLGVKVNWPARILGDNQSVILNSTILSSLLKKKLIAILYHMVREATAAKIVHLLKIKGDWNFADFLTKVQTWKAFASLVSGMMC